MWFCGLDKSGGEEATGKHLREQGQWHWNDPRRADDGTSHPLAGNEAAVVLMPWARHVEGWACARLATSVRATLGAFSAGSGHRSPHRSQALRAAVTAPFFSLLSSPRGFRHLWLKPSETVANSRWQFIIEGGGRYWFLPSLQPSCVFFLSSLFIKIALGRS